MLIGIPGALLALMSTKGTLSMRFAVLVLSTAATIVAMLAAPAEAAAKRHVPSQTSSTAIPRQYKAVCRTKVIRVHTEKWVELRRTQRCFTGDR